jgi:hypothetical protein
MISVEHGAIVAGAASLLLNCLEEAQNTSSLFKLHLYVRAVLHSLAAAGFFILAVILAGVYQ